MGRNVLVTGATGFIGRRLVRQLVSRGDNVSCLVRATSKVSEFARMNCSIICGDIVQTPESIVDAVAHVDTVYHLAASMLAIHRSDLVKANGDGTHNVFQACAAQQSPPTIVFVSSLAAVGPNQGSQARDETLPRNPISFYGRGKAAGELSAIEYSNRLPISIVRPPIVLGGGDCHGLILFKSIDRWGWHFVPGLSDQLYSVIHVDDLVAALIGVAERGKRLNEESPSQGIYFASVNETYTYAGLGKLIGQALGRKRTRILRVAKPCVWGIAAIHELKGRVGGKPQFLNFDKFHEAFGGSWTCLNKKIREEVGVVPEKSMLERMIQTAVWYRTHGWLSTKPTRPLHPTKEAV